MPQLAIINHGAKNQFGSLPDHSASMGQVKMMTFNNTDIASFGAESKTRDFATQRFDGKKSSSVSSNREGFRTMQQAAGQFPMSTRNEDLSIIGIQSTSTYNHPTKLMSSQMQQLPGSNFLNRSGQQNKVNCHFCNIILITYT